MRPGTLCQDRYGQHDNFIDLVISFMQDDVNGSSRTRFLFVHVTNSTSCGIELFHDYEKDPRCRVLVR